MAETKKKQAKEEPVKRLKALLVDRLHFDPVKPPVKCSLEGDAVVLEGTVDNIAEKKRSLFIAMATAMGAEGITGVVDRVRVRPSREMTDLEIRNHMRDAIAGEQSLSSYDISVEVADGVVDLEGTVDSLTHKRLAGVLAWWIPGSTDVINSLEVDPPEEDSEDEIADALRIVYDKDRLVKPEAVSVKVRGFVVTLTGTVSSEVERDAARDDAWYIWGVNEVVDKLQVGR